MTEEDPHINIEEIIQQLRQDPLARKLSIYSEIYGNQMAVDEVLKTRMSHTDIQERLIHLNTNILNLLKQLEPEVSHLFYKGVLVSIESEVSEGDNTEIWDDTQLSNFMEKLGSDILRGLFSCKKD